MIPADRIRAAAERLREVAGAATPGPWSARRPECDLCDGPLVQAPVTGVDVVPEWQTSDENAAYIATMNPLAALALADWLDDEYDDIPRYGNLMYRDLPIDQAPAVRLADAVLGVREVTA